MRTELPMVRRRTFAGYSTLIGFLCIIAGILLGMKYVAGIPSFSHDIGYALIWIMLVSTGACCALLLGGAMLVFDVFVRTHKTCHYCKKTVYNFQTRYLVQWIEPALYSRERVPLKAVMHTACHDAASEKFKFPDPEISDISF